MIFSPSNTTAVLSAKAGPLENIVNLSATHRVGFGPTTALWLTGLLLLTSVLGTSAKADVYRWVEDDGTVNYGEREPRDRDFTVISRSTTPAKVPPPRTSNRFASEANKNQRGQAQNAPADSTEPGRPQVADDNLSDHQKALLDRLKADEERRQEGIAEIRKSNCATSKRVLSQMQSRGRIRVRNDEGEESAMSDEDRSERIRQAQESIAVNCDSLS